MILFINGPFGVGKTTVAKLLVERIPRATLYDPEAIGVVLRRTLGPFTKVEDYQDYSFWPRLVVGGARLSRAVYRRTLVIPMTMWKRSVFDPVVAGLRRVDPVLRYVRLTAPRDVLVERISSDTEDTGAYAWRASHVETCLEAMRDPAFGIEVRTGGLAPAMVADQILRRLSSPAGWSRD